MQCRFVAIPQCWIPTPEHMLQYPQAIDEEMHMSIAQLVHMLHANQPITAPVPPNTFVFGLVPFRMITKTDAGRVVAVVSGWDDTVDMSPFAWVMPSALSIW